MTDATRPNAQAEAALSQAITISRHGRSAPLRQQRSGRLDRRSLAKVGVADPRVFIRKSAPGPDRIRVTILLDASGSMSMRDWSPGGDRSRTLQELAAQTGRNLAGATERLPWVTADLMAFTNGSPGVLVFPIWASGDPLGDVDSYFRVPRGGTEEGYAIAYALDEIIEKRQPREQGLIIIVSDGAPSEPRHVKSVVETARAHGVPVVSVALVPSAHQPTMYGRENVVDYSKSSRKLARDMARVIGRVL